MSSRALDSNHRSAWHDCAKLIIPVISSDSHLNSIIVTVS